jgi:LysR family hydrogen peroxide-inducible transcriptional activator
MVEVPLYSETFVLVVPIGHKLAGRAEIGLGELNGLPLLLLDEGHCLRDQTLELCRTNRVHPDAVGDTRAASLATVVQCVSGGLGVTLIPEMAVAVETAKGVDTARFTAPAPGRTLGLVFRGSSARSEDYEHLAALMRTLRPA